MRLYTSKLPHGESFRAGWRHWLCSGKLSGLCLYLGFLWNIFFIFPSLPVIIQNLAKIPKHLGGKAWKPSEPSPWLQWPFPTGEYVPGHLKSEPKGPILTQSHTNAQSSWKGNSQACLSHFLHSYCFHELLANGIVFLGGETQIVEAPQHLTLNEESMQRELHVLKNFGFSKKAQSTALKVSLDSTSYKIFLEIPPSWVEAPGYPRDISTTALITAFWDDILTYWSDHDLPWFLHRQGPLFLSWSPLCLALCLAWNGASANIY